MTRLRDSAVTRLCREEPGEVFVTVSSSEILDLPQDKRARAFLMGRLAAQLRMDRGETWDAREIAGWRAKAAHELLLDAEIERLEAQAARAYARMCAETNAAYRQRHDLEKTR